MMTAGELARRRRQIYRRIRVTLALRRAGQPAALPDRPGPRQRAAPIGADPADPLADPLADPSEPLTGPPAQPAPED